MTHYPTPSDPAPDLLTAEQVAEILSRRLGRTLRPAAIASMRRRGQIGAVATSPSGSIWWRYTAEDVEAYIASRLAAATPTVRPAPATSRVPGRATRRKSA